MRRRLLPLAPLIGLWATACGYPSYAFEPDDSGAPSDDSAIDAAHDAVDSTTNETAADTTGAETIVDAPIDTTIDETSLDGAEAADAFDAAESGSTGCLGSTALFCDDYDHVTYPDETWDGTNLLAGGTNALDTAYSTSSPNSFLASLPVTTALEVSASMDKAFVAPTAGAFAMLDLWMRLDLAADGDGIQLLKIQGLGTGKGIGLLLAATGLVVETVGSPGADYPLSMLTPTGRWMHVRLQTNLVATSAHATLWIDDMTTPVFNRTDLSTASVTAESNYVLVVGLYSTTAVTTAVSARYDDVSFAFP